MSEHQFKPGEKALMPVVIDEIKGGMATFSPDMPHEKFDYDPIFAEGYWIALDQFLPFPREGEYRLTVEELLLLIRLALIEEDFSGTNHDTLEVYIPSRGKLTSGEIEAWLTSHLEYVKQYKQANFVKQWLANRKEDK